MESCLISMNDFYESSEKIIESNKEEYGERYYLLKWVSEDDAKKATESRKELLSFLDSYVKFGFHNTKLDCTSLSKGCQICGEGKWSCLFVNEKCNCGCFYCPAEQRKIGEPTTNMLTFPSPDDYVDYIERFNFSGVGLSGGEPLLTFDRTLNLTKKIKKRFRNTVYVWMYTNSTLVNEENLSKLRDAGLDEIRFDIGAVNYKLDKLKLAVGIIPFVTIEIPAIPEDYELLKSKIHEMKEIGLNFLNLHQLRLTPYNYEKLSKRPYTYLHGPKVTVMESELAALGLIKFSIENKINLPINYCSFVYKDRYQKQSARKRGALIIKKPYEDVTEKGYIRTLSLTGSSDELSRQSCLFAQSGCDQSLWSFSDSKDRIFFSQALWHYVRFDSLKLCVGYHETAILPSLSYRNIFLDVKLNRNKKIVVERKPLLKEIELGPAEVPLYEELVINDNRDKIIADPYLRNIREFEFVRDGLQMYF